MPKRDEEEYDEVEEGEIEEIDLEEDEDEDEDEDDYMDMGGLLSQVLTTPEGDTLCGALVKISNAMETQNKILVKILTTLSQKKA